MADQPEAKYTRHTIQTIAISLLTIFGVPVLLFIGQTTMTTFNGQRENSTDIRYIQERIADLRQQQAAMEARLRETERSVTILEREIADIPRKTR